MAGREPHPDDPFPGAVPLPLDGVLDLHGFRPADVGDLVPEWLDASASAGLTELRIVHGKGTGALRRTVEALLARHPRVAAFRTAGEDAGGWGATLVTLKR
jgi:dsDNA-specific endonuclease/ATPase MutS2